jgi:hypothetical protein
VGQIRHFVFGKVRRKKDLKSTFPFVFSLTKTTQSKSNYLFCKNEMLVKPNILSLTCTCFNSVPAFSSPNYSKLILFSTQSWMLCLSCLYFFLLAFVWQAAVSFL